MSRTARFAAVLSILQAMAFVSLPASVKAVKDPDCLIGDWCCMGDPQGKCAGPHDSFCCFVDGPGQLSSCDCYEF